MPQQDGTFDAPAGDLTPGDWVRERRGGFEVAAVKPAQGRIQVLGTDERVRSYHESEILARRPGRGGGRTGPPRRRVGGDSKTPVL